MNRMKWIGVLIGVGLFVWILRQADLPVVWSYIRRLQWRFGIILLWYAVIFGLDTLGWRAALGPDSQRRVRWTELFQVRLAGEALNYVTPTAWVGGEPVKAYLLSKRYGVPMTDGMASVVIAKTTFTLSMLVFILTGLLVTIVTQPLPITIWRWVWMILPVLSLLVALFILVQFVRPFGRGAGAMGRWAPSWLRTIPEKIHEWDQALVTFYRRSPRQLTASLMFHLVGWLAGVVEVYLILRFLQIPVSVATAWSIEALWLLLKTGVFLIPGSLGASEAIVSVVCAGLGLSTAAGLALGLVRRARELLWVGLGLIECGRG